MPTQYQTTGELVAENKVVYQSTDAPPLTWTILDSAGAALDVSSGITQLLVWKHRASYSSWHLLTEAGVVVSDTNTVTATYAAANVSTTGTYRYALVHDVGGSERVIAYGSLTVLPVRFTEPE